MSISTHIYLGTSFILEQISKAFGIANEGQLPKHGICWGWVFWIQTGGLQVQFQVLEKTKESTSLNQVIYTLPHQKKKKRNGCGHMRSWQVIISGELVIQESQVSL